MPLRPHARTIQQVRLLRSLRLTKRRPGRAPRQLPPKPIELEYYRAIQRLVCAPLVKILDEIRSGLVREVRAARGDAKGVDEPGLTIAAAHAVRRAGQLAADAWKPAEVERAAAQYARRADDWNKKELGKQVQKALGVPLEAIERPTVDRIPAFVAENVALIKTVPERALDRVGALAEEALATGMTAEEMADRLQEIGEISENDAMRIARDQIGKLVAQVNVDRQQALGVTRAIWRTMKDNRVRDEHHDREGQEFDLSEGIDGELPGEPIQCRCYSEPIFDFAAEALED